MLYVYDVWVNWTEVEECEFKIPHFHEWRKSDVVEIMDQIPLIVTTEKVYEYITNGLNSLPHELLDLVFYKAHKRYNNRKKALEYAFIVSDGVRAMAINTQGFDFPYCKSRLIPRQERLVLDLVNKEDMYNYEIDEKRLENKEIEDLKNPKYYIGLSRKERDMKDILFLFLSNLEKSDDKHEILYWLSEWDVEIYKKSLDLEKEEIIKLFEDVRVGWTGKHEELCKRIAESNSIYKINFELIMGKEDSYLGT